MYRAFQSAVGRQDTLGNKIGESVRNASVERSGVCVSSALREVVCFVDKKDVVFPYILKVSAEADGKVEGVIVIAYYDIAVFAQVERKLVGTYHIIGGAFFDKLGRKYVRLSEKIEQSGIAPCFIRRCTDG